MIASIQGKVAAVHQDYVVVVVQGIGYKVFSPAAQRLSINEDILLYTSMIVREDSLSLYGFTSDSERGLFDTLLTISGVGPRVAVSILATLSMDNLRNAVVSDRAEILTRVPGIGKKTAQKILFELKDKLSIGLEAAPVDSFTDVNTDVIDTLVALGYSIVEAQTAVQNLPKDAPQDVEERVRLALQYFM
ncbi:MAG: Holliday junction branch migration protein RuvA [Anaerolineae bacterium]